MMMVMMMMMMIVIVIVITIIRIMLPMTDCDETNDFGAWLGFDDDDAPGHARSVQQGDLGSAIFIGKEVMIGHSCGENKDWGI